MSGDYDWGLTPQAIEEVRQGMVVSVAVEVDVGSGRAILEAHEPKEIS